MISQREYARRKGISSPYISKLVQKGIITVDNEGKLAEEVADFERARATVIGRGQRKWAPQHGKASRAVCQGCGETFNPELSRGFRTAQSERFCTPDCEREFRAMRAEDARRLN